MEKIRLVLFIIGVSFLLFFCGVLFPILPPPQKTCHIMPIVKSVWREIFLPIICLFKRKIDCRMQCNQVILQSCCKYHFSYYNDSFLWAGIFLYLQSNLNPWDVSKTNEDREISLICFCFVVSIQEHNHSYRQATRWPPGGLTHRHGPLHGGDHPTASRSAHPDAYLQPFLFLTSSSHWLSPVGYIKAGLPLHLIDLLFSAAGGFFFSSRGTLTGAQGSAFPALLPCSPSDSPPP